MSHICDGEFDSGSLCPERRVGVFAGVSPVCSAQVLRRDGSGTGHGYGQRPGPRTLPAGVTLVLGSSRGTHRAWK